MTEWLKMKNIIQTFLFVFVILLSACGNSVDYEYSSHRNFFTFHNETHQDPILASAMNQLSPGVYCTIRTNFINGRYCFFFENNQGMKSNTPVWFDGIDYRLESWKRVGMNNGLIVGYGNLDNPSPFYAYDLQCPNCFGTKEPPFHSYELKINSNGYALCNNCHRRYNLNTGGNVVSHEGGKKLTRYKANSTAPYGLLSVN